MRAGSARAITAPFNKGAVGIQKVHAAGAQLAQHGPRLRSAHGHRFRHLIIVEPAARQVAGHTRQQRATHGKRQVPFERQHRVDLARRIGQRRRKPTLIRGTVAVLVKQAVDLAGPETGAHVGNAGIAHCRPVPALAPSSATSSAASSCLARLRTVAHASSRSAALTSSRPLAAASASVFGLPDVVQ